MPVSFSVEGPDSEDLNSVFSRGEWGHEERIMLDVSFPLLAKVLGSEDDPLESITVPHLLAIAYAVGWSSKMLSVVNPIDFAGQLEAAIEARGDIQISARRPIRIWRRPRGSLRLRFNWMRSICMCRCMAPSTLSLDM